MERLPAELYDEIRNHLRKASRLAPYAAISKRWQASVENRNFRTVTIVDSDIPTFAAMFVGPNVSRRAILRELGLGVEPGPDVQQKKEGCCAVGMPAPDRAAEGAFLFKRLAELFSSLADIEARLPRKYPLYVRLDGMTSVDPRLKIVGGDALVDLEWLSIETEELYQGGRRRRLGISKSLLKGISEIPGANIKHFRLRVDHQGMENEDVPVPRMTKPDKWKNETYSLIGKTLSSWNNLAVLHLQGPIVISPQFFRCITDAPGSAFSSLRELSLDVAPETADGRWFLTKDEQAFKDSLVEYGWYWEPEHNDEANLEPVDAECGFKVYGEGRAFLEIVRRKVYMTLPSKDILFPLFVGAAETVKKLPRLHKLEVKLNTDRSKLAYEFLQYCHFELCFLKAGQSQSPKKPQNPIWYRWLQPRHGQFPTVTDDYSALGFDRLYWRVGSWVPWQELQEAWRTALGPDGKIAFLENDEEHWEPGYGRKTYNGPLKLVQP
ncbi:hypothetical protein M011DRAFT_475110 [Sporormia fimetaria CBS 119925]|uniref:F-box domain-containing protein n=1 Tax=Sporormia fimetaria CBS 119925 TaxID=1340428 RepID=A0A6A6VIY8_9PLEO|nr:hypothetical protein M011DRAFT_475110 [Sporormia fimetaria CBS 119925]